MLLAISVLIKNLTPRISHVSSYFFALVLVLKGTLYKVDLSNANQNPFRHISLVKTFWLFSKPLWGTSERSF